MTQNVTIKKVAIISLIALFLAAILLAAVLFLSKTYEIKYELNGGSVENANKEFYTFLTEDFGIYNPTKEGYTFIGWTGTGITTPQTELKIPRASTGNRYFRANWKPDTYTLNFDTAGGELSFGSQSVTYDSKTELPIPTKVGYVFEGWYVGDLKYSDEIWKHTSDLTLTARWSASDYTVKFECIKQIVTSSEINYEYAPDCVYTAKVSFDSVQTLPSPERNGYVFLGWYNGDEKIESGAWSIPSDVTLSPKWMLGENTITLNANGGELSQNTVKVFYEAPFTLPIPERVGYTFDGWYNGNTKYEDGTWTELSDVTLSAKWNPGTYKVTYNDLTEIKTSVTITFDPNHEDSAATYVTLTDGQRLPYPEVPTREGYAFIGWFTEKDGSKIFDFCGEITKDTTLYAKWHPMIKSSGAAEYVDIALHNSFENRKTVIIPSDQQAPSFYYFTCYSSCTCRLFADQASGDYYITVYNATKGVTVLEENNLYDDHRNLSVTFNVEVGDIVFVKLQGYSASAPTSHGSFYVQGMERPTSTATAACGLEEAYLYTSDHTVTKSVVYNSSFTAPLPKRVGYRFLGWFNGDKRFDSATFNLTSDLTLNSKWEPLNYTVTLDPCGGVLEKLSIPVSFEKDFDLPIPEKVGYSFDGWFDENGEFTDSVYTRDSDVSLFAKWTPKTYKITYSNIKIQADIVVTLDYACPEIDSDTITLNSGEVLPYPDVPMRSGFAFAGWYSDALYNELYTFDEMITEDITLYAKWVSMYPSAYTSEYVDIAKYNNSTSQKGVVVTAVSQANKNYYYFTCYESGLFTIHLNRTVGDFYVSVYNLTEGASLIYNYNMYGTYPSISETFFAEAGDVVYLNFYNYGGDYGAECSFYVENAAYPKSTSTAAPDLVERYVYDSNSASTVSQTVTYGSAYSLVIPEKAGSTFVGWYNGSKRIEEGTWLIDSDVTLTPIWE